ncbi:hypothetical protein APSETT445_000079 [Aspergillus pseudonomiae]
MSLVQRVSAIDGVDNVDVVETASILSIPIRREISYDVLPPPPVEERLDTKAATPAYRVSTAKRLGVYRNLCTETVLPKEGNMLRMNYFIATVRSQYEFMLHSERQAGTINDFFDVALPVGGVLSTPLIGLLLDNLSVPATLAVIVLLTTTTGVLNSVPAVWTGYLTVILFVLLRPYYYSAMSDYATKVFGFGTFGRVYGTIICFSGLVNFAQYLLDYLTHGPFHGNPIPINIFLATAGLIVGATLVTFVYIAEKRWREEKRAECDEERQRLIPEEAEEEQA